MKRILIILGFITFYYAQIIGQEKPLIVTTATIMADMTKNIGGDRITIKSIVPIGGDPHTYDATPEDAELAENADLIIKNGLTFEGWLDELIDNSGTKARVVTITEGIEAIESLTYKNTSDPHAWMDPVLALVYIENIREALTELLPQFEDEFQFNHDVYKEQLQQLHVYCQSRIEEIPEGQRILITSHDAFQYYGRRYGLQLEAILGTSTDADVQTSDIQRVTQIINEKPVPAVFIESTVNPKLLQQLADDNGIVIGGQLYSDSLGDEDGPAPTYEKMIRHNTDVIVNALSKERKIADNPPVTETRIYWIILGVAIIALILFILRLINNRE
ncbi:MAG: zinc ABC transporter substrate-binding protein [Saprospiraceae bacterium]|nr:zinc ABC transporter substrate-binding protein [Saprospiraceae bacterium]